MRHIRKSNANVTDHRFRFVAGYANKMRPTYCGADPTANDLSKKDGLHSATVLAPVAQNWPQVAKMIDGICPDCTKLLMAAHKSVVKGAH